MTNFSTVANEIETILTSSDNPEKVIMEMYRTTNDERKETILASLLGVAISKTKQLKSRNHDIR